MLPPFGVVIRNESIMSSGRSAYNVGDRVGMTHDLRLSRMHRLHHLRIRHGG